MRNPTLAAAIQAINKQGALLVYPIDNRPAPSSLWSVFFPKSEMRWEWDNDGDDRVAHLWHLKTELSSSRKVVYSKWFRGRATFFSEEVFTLFLAASESSSPQASSIFTREAKQILDALEMDSPLSTKQIKLQTDLRGKVFESTYEKAMKQLWSQFYIVGFGEVEDGAFPSLAIGATRVIFEDLWEKSKKISKVIALKRLQEKLGEDSLFLSHLGKLQKK